LKRNFTILFALVLALSLVMLPASVVQASNLYEYYNTGEDNAVGFHSTYWMAQTFNATSDHSVTSVKLLLWRVGTIGTVTVSIRATDGGGHPTGSDLTSGTIDGNTLTTVPWGLWYEIALSPYDLTKDTKYAIVVRAPDATLPDNLRWSYDSTGTYAGGDMEDSSDSGTTWETTLVDLDFMFEVWGEGAVEVGGEVYPVNKLSVLAPWIVLVAAILGGATIVVRRRRAQS
jgi:hypothetical protein